MSEDSLEYFSFESSSSENLADLSAQSSPSLVPEKRPPFPLHQQVQERLQFFQSLPAQEERLAQAQQVEHLPDLQQVQPSLTENQQLDQQQQHQWQETTGLPFNVGSQSFIRSSNENSRRWQWILAQPQQQLESGFLRQLQRQKHPEYNAVEHEQELHFVQQPSMQRQRQREHVLNSLRAAAHSASFQPSLTPYSSLATVEGGNHYRQTQESWASSVSPEALLLTPTSSSSFSSSAVPVGGVSVDSEGSYSSTPQPFRQSTDEAVPGAAASAPTAQHVSHAGSAVCLIHPDQTAEQTTLPYRCFSDTEAVLDYQLQSPELPNFGTPAPSLASSPGLSSVLQQSQQQQPTLLSRDSETLRGRANSTSTRVGRRKHLRSTEKAAAAASLPVAAAAPLFPSATVTAARPASAAAIPPLPPRKTGAAELLGLPKVQVPSPCSPLTKAHLPPAGADSSAAAEDDSTRESEGQRALLRNLLWPSEANVEEADVFTHQEQQQLSSGERGRFLSQLSARSERRAATAAAAQTRDLLLTAESPAASSLVLSHSGGDASAASSSAELPSISSSTSLSQLHRISPAADDPQPAGAPPSAFLCSQETTSVAPFGAVLSHVERQSFVQGADTKASADTGTVSFAAFPSWSSQRERGTIAAPAASTGPAALLAASEQWPLDPISKARQEAAVGATSTTDVRHRFSHRAGAASRAYTAAATTTATENHLFASTTLPHTEKTSTERLPIRAAFSSPAVFSASTPPLQTMSQQQQQRLLQQPNQQQMLHATAPVPLERREPAASTARFCAPAAAPPFPVQQQLQHAQFPKPTPGAYQSRKWVAETVYRPLDVVTRTVEIPLVRNVDIFVRRPVIKEKVVEIPKLVPHYVEKIVEVPEVHWVDKVVEVPEVLYKTRLVPKTEIRENIIEQPFIEEQWIEKYVEVPRVEEIVRFQEVVEIEDVIKYIPKNHSEEEWRGAPIYSIPPEHAPPLPPKLPAPTADDFIYRTPAAVGAAAGFTHRPAAAAEGTAYNKPIAPQQYPSRDAQENLGFRGQNLSQLQAEHAAHTAFTLGNGLRPGEQVTFH